MRQPKRGQALRCVAAGVCGVPDIEIDAGRFATLNTMIQAENLPNQTHYREVLSQIVSPNSALVCPTSSAALPSMVVQRLRAAAQSLMLYSALCSCSV